MNKSNKILKYQYKKIMYKKNKQKQNKAII